MAAPSICSEEEFIENVATNGAGVVVVVVVEVVVEFVSSGAVDEMLTVWKIQSHVYYDMIIVRVIVFIIDNIPYVRID